MNDSAIQKIDKIIDFIDNYMKSSQERGEMYGTIEVLESNWCLLNKIDFILNDIDEEGLSFSDFLLYKGYGAKSASTVIKEKKIKKEYTELNIIWSEYVEWRKSKAIR